MSHWSTRQQAVIRRACGFASVMILIEVLGCDTRQSMDRSSSANSVESRCVQQMRTALSDEKTWVKVHAAEFLISLDYRQGVSDVFESQEHRLGSRPQDRIGIWRVLAQLNRHDPIKHQQSISRIHSVFVNRESSDRVHAAEALAKLDYKFDHPIATVTEAQHDGTEISEYADLAIRGPPAAQGYGLWILLNNGAADAEARLGFLLASDREVLRRTAAYALRHQASIASQTFQQLCAALESEPAASQARVYLLTAVLKHAIQQARTDIRKSLYGEVMDLLRDGSPTQQYEASRVIADIGDTPSAKLLAMLNRGDLPLDVKSSVAHAICRIERRAASRMSRGDWLVVACYAIGMLAIGLFYARRTKTADDYLLGGRNMRPWAVGLSLFATLLSTLSYLAWPGEMIKNGPIILLGYAAHPLIFLVVGWLLIPRIMQLRVTSAYEILETRLGLSVRLLGSTLFLSLRFLWMASIIYWTTTIVLLPAAGLNQDYAGPVSLALGLVTVVYTSLGGLRAVVMTDVIQTFILFSGAIASLILITNSLGGVSQWLPREWAPHWTAPRLWFDFSPNARSTLANAMLGTFSWYVCTAGSDQMAIQRYLATRDVKAARRTLAVSLTTDLLVVSFLGLMGLALLAFFSAHPDKMADGQSIYANADKLFPRFVVVGLPIGASGLVIAGLLAAAMSSLSSGINSSAAVISEDFVHRLSCSVGTDSQRVRLVRWASALIGLSVVLLSSLIGKVEGNMLEVIYKVVNLFVSPLFFLFFMALFVPWATPFGTWIGAVTGIATAILIAFWKDLFGIQGISFLWIMPGSFTVACAVGCVTSRLWPCRGTRTSTASHTR